MVVHAVFPVDAQLLELVELPCPERLLVDVGADEFYMELATRVGFQQGAHPIAEAPAQGFGVVEYFISPTP